MSGHCQVDFYVLESSGQSASHLACRLALMAWEQGHRVSVLMEDRNQVETLDELMWESPAGRFLPHSTGRSEHGAPVRIGTRDDGIDSDTDVLINMTSIEVSEPGNFKRLLEIVPANDAERIASRHKFRAYKASGLQPESHNIGNTK
jgi:DNA polymerase-3 subunit chi